MAPRDQRVLPKACSNCRRKKIRCDLNKPACRNCTQVYHVECTYDASLSYRSAEVLLARVAKAEGLLQMLSDDPNTLPTVLSEWQCSRASHTSLNTSASLDSHDGQSVNDRSLTSPASLLPASSVARSSPAVPSPSETASSVPAQVAPRSFRRPGADADANDHMHFIRRLPTDLIDHLQYIHWTWQWPLHCFIDREALIHDLAHLQTDQPRYASPLLLLTLLAHAARFSNRANVQTSSSKESFKVGGIFFTRAKHLLYKQIDLPPTLPDTTAILMMASRQAACGSFTQAWVYAGVSIRMIEDMGIPSMAMSIASSPRQSEALQDPETRRAWRLFWSAMTFDKTLAFGLGRKPALLWPGDIQEVCFGQPASDDFLFWPECSQASAVHDPSGLKIPVMAALGDEAQGASAETVQGRAPHYPYETFACWCCLAALFGNILELNNRPHRYTSIDAQTPHVRIGLRERLLEWKRKLPEHIAIEDPRLEPVSRPPNIISVNMIYQVCRILLHSDGHSGPSRTMRVDDLVDSSTIHTQMSQNDDYEQDIQICRDAAIQIHALLELWSRTFSFDRMTWLMGCCAYTAAVVIAQDVCHPSLDTARRAAARLNFVTHALGVSASFTPAIRKSTSALFEFAQRINAEHHTRSYMLSETASVQSFDGPSDAGSVIFSSASWSVSDALPAFDNEQPGNGVVANEPLRRSKRKTHPGADQSTPVRYSPTSANDPPLNGLDNRDQGEWNLGFVDLDTMFKEVLDAEIGQESHSLTQDQSLPPPHSPPDLNQQSSPAGKSRASPRPSHVPAPETVSWVNNLGTSHWNLDALINDKDLLDALGALPLYPGEQL